MIFAAHYIVVSNPCRAPRVEAGLLREVGPLETLQTGAQCITPHSLPSERT